MNENQNNTAKQTTLLFLVKNDKILLAMKKRGFGAGRWNGVGGKLETGETIQQGVIRECQEEITATPRQMEKVATHTFKFVEDNTPDIHTHTFICRDWKGEPVETEEMAPKWFKYHDIPYDEMWQDDILWLPLILRGQKVITTFEFDEQDNMLSASLRVVDTLE